MRPRKFFILAIVCGNCGWLWLVMKVPRKMSCKQLLCSPYGNAGVCKVIHKRQ